VDLGSGVVVVRNGLERIVNDARQKGEQVAILALG
jgi:hypothetical protein